MHFINDLMSSKKVFHFTRNKIFFQLYKISKTCQCKNSSKLSYLHRILLMQETAKKEASLTSEVNIPAQVPMHQATSGLVILPDFICSITLYSSTPPTWKRKVNSHQIGFQTNRILSRELSFYNRSGQTCLLKEPQITKFLSFKATWYKNSSITLVDMKFLSSLCFPSFFHSTSMNNASLKFSIKISN